jgi:hypothetical protein
MTINWQQVLATVLANTLLLSVLAFIGRKAVDQWLERKLESYRSNLRRSEAEHGFRFEHLHSQRAAAITELYRLMVELFRHIERSAQGIHQYADDQVSIPREDRIALSLAAYNDAVANLRMFRSHFEQSRIYFSDPLVANVSRLIIQLHDLFEDLETSLMPNPPNVEPPPSIAAIWEAQKKLRLLVQPLREAVENEFRRLLGVIEGDDLVPRSTD